MEGQRNLRDTAPDGNARPGRRVVVGVDGSAGARAALVRAVGEAVRRGAGLDVVTACRVVLPWAMGNPVVVAGIDDVLDDARSRARTQLEEALTDAAPAAPGADVLHARIVAVDGAPAQALIDESEGAELLVVGSRGRGAVRSALLGSVALHCISHARCPVLVVHGRSGQPQPAAPVVVGLDGSPESLAACRLAVEEAARLGVDVEVVTAFATADFWPDSVPVPSLPEIHGQLEQRAEELSAHARREAVLAEGARDPEVRVSVVEGPAQDALLQRARDASLVVVGSRGHGAIRGMLLGSVALHVAMHAATPVLVAHGADPLPEQESAESAELTRG